MCKFEANSGLFNEDLRKFWPISAFPQQNHPKSDRLLEQELPEHFHFLLHGHEHWDRVTPMDVHTHIHTRIAAGACYGSSTQESGYNIVRLNPDKGTGEVWLREYDERGGVWVSKIVHGRTGGEPKGVWRLAVNCSRKDG
uniref:Calcineurin-like phosphoesterase n=1 Tax=Candidatus Kentrum sp. DK TaxID=2126562 RepID=A0A450TGY8_9GAMM|nr:MAG: hypothetical protein BECKDK2373C_GA0170839_11492 [Candidatus Kentron sp. DK]